MATLQVRNVPDEVVAWLAAEAARRDQSVAALVRSLLKARFDLRLRSEADWDQAGRETP
jgi:plasmid stability protein